MSPASEEDSNWLPSSSSPSKAGAGARPAGSTTVAAGVAPVNSYSPPGEVWSTFCDEQPTSAAAAAAASSARLLRTVRTTLPVRITGPR
jgi:hypothetical protein